MYCTSTTWLKLLGLCVAVFNAIAQDNGQPGYCNLQRACIGFSISGCTPEGKRGVCATNYCGAPENRQWCKVPTAPSTTYETQLLQNGLTMCQVVEASQPNQVAKFTVRDGDGGYQCGTATSDPVTPLGTTSSAVCEKPSDGGDQCWGSDLEACVWSVAVPECSLLELTAAQSNATEEESPSQFAVVSGAGRLQSFNGKEYAFRSSNGTFVLLSLPEFQINVEFENPEELNGTYLMSVGLIYNQHRIILVSHNELDMPELAAAHLAVLLVDEQLPLSVPTATSGPIMSYLQVNEDINLFMSSTQDGREIVSLSTPTLLLTATKPANATHMELAIETVAAEVDYVGLMDGVQMNWREDAAGRDSNVVDERQYRVSWLLDTDVKRKFVDTDVLKHDENPLTSQRKLFGTV